ncbi:MAG: polysaccharide pyruvyl transferase family protein [Methanocorpusculum sp.]|nr:polysaccharide pyruvyl transferase family protein [Methanocorpusculum sp.]
MKLTTYIPKSLKDKLKPYYFRFIYRAQVSDFRDTKKAAVRFILIGSPEHRNLGDHAIAEAERNFFAKHFPDTPLVELSGPCYRSLPEITQSKIRPDDIICITGGGFLGSLWMIEEDMVRDVLQSFPDNQVIIFPQTVYFEDTVHGKEELAKSKKIYGECKNLKIFLREKKSYDYVIENFDISKDRVFLIPDMVLSITANSAAGTNRDSILLCLRGDKESCLSENLKSNLTSSLENFGCRISCVDTVVQREVSLSERKQELDSIFQTFSSAKLVITDRLHGMLFAVITGTPCIAMNQVSGKVAGVYEWIKDLEYVSFVEDVSEIVKEADRLLRLPTQKYNPEFLNDEFEQLCSELDKCLKGDTERYD